MKHKLPLPEQNDFHCLLSLLPALHNIPEFAWLPELYSLIDEPALTKLCSVAGGETIRIPTLEELQFSIDSLQWYYDIYISQRKQLKELPAEFAASVQQIHATFSAGDEDVRDSEEPSTRS